MTLRTLLIGAAVAAVAIPTVGYASWSGESGLSVQKRAEIYSIEKIEKTWHKSMSKKNLNLMMSLWARNASMTQGGKTFIGKTAIRGVFAKSGPFQKNRWVSETPAYKMRVTVNGNKGTLYFECDFVDAETLKLAAATGADLELRKVKGKWLITHMSGSSVTLKP